MYERAWDLGHAGAGVYLAEYLEGDENVGGVGPDHPHRAKILEYYRESARRGDIHAEVKLGDYAWASGDKAKAKRHLIKAACAGDEQSMSNLKGFYRIDI